MSSDTFTITLLSIAGDTAELLCATSTAGGVNDYAVTRSFALMALEDGMAYQAKTPLQQGIAPSGVEPLSSAPAPGLFHGQFHVAFVSLHGVSSSTTS